MDLNVQRIVKLKSEIDSIISWLKPYISLANSHLVGYIVNDHWNKQLPEALRREIEQNSCNSAEKFFWRIRDCLEKEEHDKAFNLSVSCRFPELFKYMNSSWSKCIKIDEDVCLSKDAFISRFDEMPEKYPVMEFMSEKKYHEVQRMSLCVAAMAKMSSATHCIDVGGGKGYLSATLAMLYGVKVLSVDYNDVNVRGAKQMRSKIEKLWPTLLRKANGSVKPSTDLMNKNQSYLDCYKNATHFITEDTELEKLIMQSFSPMNKTNEDIIKICLTGLHTCGDLGADSLRLFNANKCVTSLINVPCCYNRLIECVWDTSDLWFPLEEFKLDFKGNHGGFPMSAHVKAMEFSVGRSALMLTAQPIHRLTVFQKIPTQINFYRALLQVILRDEYDMKEVPEGRLRGLGNKCPDFNTYVTEALRKLKLAPSLNCHSSKVEQYKLDYERFQIFCMIRLCLAPVIESLILLDRLLYLAECNVNGNRDSYLVRLFDPVISPRCYALVAIKRTE